MRKKVHPWAIFVVVAPIFIILGFVGSAIGLPWLAGVAVGGALMWAVVDWYILPLLDDASKSDDNA
ncbi:MAG TPA: hypothetical protein PKY87_18020 [Terricaulis sp.]|nr:hypothetical protein [Terricaulis sp.]